VLAVSSPQSEATAPDASRLVDFMGSYPPGDMALGELRGPMAEEPCRGSIACRSVCQPSRDGGGSAQPADADQGARPFGEAETAGQAAARAGQDLAA